MKKHRVTLTAGERGERDALLSRGKADVRKLKHARVLLRADAAEGGPGWPDARIAEAVGVATVSYAGLWVTAPIRRRGLSGCR